MVGADSLCFPCLQGASGRLEVCTWAEALAAVKAAFQNAKGNEIRAIAGKLTDAETMMATKDLLNKLGSGNMLHEGGFADMPSDVRSSYVANTTVLGLDRADVVLLIGTNPRLEAPVYNARLRKIWLDGTQVSCVPADVADYIQLLLLQTPAHVLTEYCMQSCGNSTW